MARVRFVGKMKTNLVLKEKKRKFSNKGRQTPYRQSPVSLQLHLAAGVCAVKNIVCTSSCEKEHPLTETFIYTKAKG